MIRFQREEHRLKAPYEDFGENQSGAAAGQKRGRILLVTEIME